jgi:hypothetical protein
MQIPIISAINWMLIYGKTNIYRKLSNYLKYFRSIFYDKNYASK